MATVGHHRRTPTALRRSGPVMAHLTFPDLFTWGTATSAYQIEGAVDVDGRGESIWDRFSHTPGRTAGGGTGDVACDHFHRLDDDLDLLADLGVDAYRFSIAWPRVVSAGTGPINSAGLDFYDRLVDGLLDRGITPAATLYHWDLPQALQDRGGWRNRDVAGWFADYAAAVFDRLGDRVDLWMTHNEPWMSGFIGHWRGVHAPGTTDLQAALEAIHHMLLSHGLATQALRAADHPGNIGIVLNLQPHRPVRDTAADRAAARDSDGYCNRWFLDAIMRGFYPADTQALFEGAGVHFDMVADTDLEVIATPTDFLGINYYSLRRVMADDTEFTWKVHEPPDEGVPRTSMGVEIHADSLVDLLRRVADDYDNPPILITENGAPFDTSLDDDGRLRDDDRIAFLTDHLQAAHRALRAGVDLRGWFVWSFMDNFEWAAGYAPRFGLVHVDDDTLTRTPKDSFWFYRDVIRANGVPADEPDRRTWATA